MIGHLFNAVFYNPIYNALVALVSLMPGSDVGLAVIVLTIVIRLILLPFSLSAARTQRAMKDLEPRLKELKETHKGNKEKEAIETMALYKEARVNPFASVIIAFVQLPVLIALYWVFRHEPFTALDTARLYAFTPLPAHPSLQFLGFISIAGKSLALAAIAGITQYFQAHVALSGTMKPSEGKGMQADFQKVMGTQLKYVFPIIIGVISYTIGSAIALYFITTNLFGVGQEWYVRHKLHKEQEAKTLPEAGALPEAD